MNPFVQSKAAQVSDVVGPTTITFDTKPTAGRLILLTATSYNYQKPAGGVIASVTDNHGNTYLKAAATSRGPGDSVDDLWADIWECLNANVDSGTPDFTLTITYTLTATAHNVGVLVAHEIQAIAAGSRDATGTNYTTANSVNEDVASSAITQAKVFAIACLAASSDGVTQPGSPWESVYSVQSGAAPRGHHVVVQDVNQPALGAVSAAWSHGSMTYGTAAAIVCYRQATETLRIRVLFDAAIQNVGSIEGVVFEMTATGITRCGNPIFEFSGLTAEAALDGSGNGVLFIPCDGEGLVATDTVRVLCWSGDDGHRKLVDGVVEAVGA